MKKLNFYVPLFQRIDWININRNHQVMLLKFTKMHGAGNDFVVLDGVRQHVSLSTEQLRMLADRHFGVGCDQILLVEKAHDSSADFRYRIFNADGGEVEQCGNGARCFVRFVHEQKMTAKSEIVVETHGGLIRPRLEEDGRVTVNMGAPVFAPDRLPFTDGTGGVQHVRLRVYERGSGETLSCGTGACAAVVAGIRRGLLDSPVTVATHGGTLSIAWGGEDAPVLMTGPAISVFSGEINL
jgi:diaminopimelate epimerase